MGPNTIISAPMMNDGKSKTGKRLKIIVIAVLVFAICCLGFGIYGSIDSKNKSQEISDLKAKVEEQNKTIEEQKNNLEEQNKTIEEQNKTIEDQKNVITGLSSEKTSSSVNTAIQNLCRENEWNNYIKTNPLPKL